MLLALLRRLPLPSLPLPLLLLLPPLLLPLLLPVAARRPLLRRSQLLLEDARAARLRGMAAARTIAPHLFRLPS
jgi:hypothetical protein